MLWFMLFHPLVELRGNIVWPLPCKILRVHYREEAASEACQQSNESPQQFLLCALDLRNKVNLASQESDCEFNHGLSLIQKTTAKSFEAGVCNDISLASNLRATLRTPSLNDEELMKIDNKLASQQAKHKSGNRASKNDQSECLWSSQRRGVTQV